jgi:hypothetical protein
MPLGRGAAAAPRAGDGTAVGAGAGSGRRGGAAVLGTGRAGAGAGSGAARKSYCWDPPAKAARCRLRRQRRKIPPSATTTAAMIQGKTGNRCSGVRATGVVLAAGSGAEANEPTGWRESSETAGGGEGVAAFCAGAGATSRDRASAPAFFWCATGRACSRAPSRAAVTGVCSLGSAWFAAPGTEDDDDDNGADSCSAGLVLVPGRLKFWSSRGPMASFAGVLLLVSGTVWASAGAAARSSPTATHAVFQRKPALISSRSCP